MATLHERQTHPVYVEGCFGCKAGSLRFGQVDATRQKKWDAELKEYADAVASGIQPETTQSSGIRAAVEWSEKTGKAYSAEAKLEHDTDEVLERFAV